MSELSPIQEQILLSLIEETERIERKGRAFAKRMLELWGVRWYSTELFKDEDSGSDGAALSQPLAQLVELGLVEHTNELPGDTNRAARVKLTVTGRSTAKQIRTG